MVTNKFCHQSLLIRLTYRYILIGQLSPNSINDFPYLGSSSIMKQSRISTCINGVLAASLIYLCFVGREQGAAAASALRDRPASRR